MQGAQGPDMEPAKEDHAEFVKRNPVQERSSSVSDLAADRLCGWLASTAAPGGAGEAQSMPGSQSEE